jgi:hypothetical protein
MPEKQGPEVTIPPFNARNLPTIGQFDHIISGHEKTP